MAADLTDVILWSVFRKLNANDRVIASQVCTNWYRRVLEVNRTVRSLFILVDDNSTNYNYYNLRTARGDFHSNLTTTSLGQTPCIKQQLMKEREIVEGDEADREKIECSTIGNTFIFGDSNSSQLNSTTVKHIKTVFPVITELNFINESELIKYDYLVQFLKSDPQNEDNWSQKLTSLRLLDLVDKQRSTTTSYNSKPLFDAINCLPSLRRLAIVIKELHLHDLPVLARLKELRYMDIRIRQPYLILDSVKRHAADNTALRLDVSDARLWSPTEPSIREIIIRVNDNTREIIKNMDQLGELCTDFPYLTSLTMLCSCLDDCERMFEHISRQLPRLRHLDLNINYWSNAGDDISKRLEKAYISLLNTPSPKSAMPSVKILELNLALLSFHTEGLEWLNLPVTMPNLKMIHLTSYFCEGCFSSQNATGDFDFYDFYVPAQLASARQCLPTALQQLHHITSIPLEKITYTETPNGLTISAKQLLEKMDKV